jgi:hypothetical protein
VGFSRGGAYISRKHDIVLHCKRQPLPFCSAHPRHVRVTHLHFRQSHHIWVVPWGDVRHYRQPALIIKPVAPGVEAVGKNHPSRSNEVHRGTNTRHECVWYVRWWIAAAAFVYAAHSDVGWICCGKVLQTAHAESAPGWSKVAKGAMLADTQT